MQQGMKFFSQENTCWVQPESETGDADTPVGAIRPTRSRRPSDREAVRFGHLVGLPPFVKSRRYAASLSSRSSRCSMSRSNAP